MPRLRVTERNIRNIKKKLALLPVSPQLQFANTTVNGNEIEREHAKLCTQKQETRTSAILLATDKYFLPTFATLKFAILSDQTLCSTHAASPPEANLVS